MTRFTTTTTNATSPPRNVCVPRHRRRLGYPVPRCETFYHGLVPLLLPSTAPPAPTVARHGVGIGFDAQSTARAPLTSPLHAGHGLVPSLSPPPAPPPFGFAPALSNDPLLWHLLPQVSHFYLLLLHQRAVTRLSIGIGAVKRLTATSPANLHFVAATTPVPPLPAPS